jgi:hypothetical protein
LVYLLVFLFPNSYTILFWEFYLSMSLCLKLVFCQPALTYVTFILGLVNDTTIYESVKLKSKLF